MIRKLVPALVLFATVSPSWSSAQGVVLQPKAAVQAEHGWLGVMLADAPKPTIAEVVPDSPASEAGLQVGDVFVAVGGDAVETVDAFVAAIRANPAGKKVELSIQRGDRRLAVEVELGRRPDSAAAVPAPSTRAAERGRAPAPAAETGPEAAAAAPQDQDRPFLGVSLVDTERGALVEEVVPDSPAAAAGIRVGDVLRRIGSRRVHDIEGAVRALARLKPKATVEVEVQRGDGRRELAVTLGRVTEGEDSPVDEVELDEPAEPPSTAAEPAPILNEVRAELERELARVRAEVERARAELESARRAREPAAARARPPAVRQAPDRAGTEYERVRRELARVHEELGAVRKEMAELRALLEKLLRDR